ncbi:hypothetical protein HG531_011155 [Fusarium graminearum]|nr:hypothetical protein HG531_011155 [Fusarium graminearum]
MHKVVADSRAEGPVGFDDKTDLVALVAVILGDGGADDVCPLFHAAGKGCRRRIRCDGLVAYGLGRCENLSIPSYWDADQGGRTVDGLELDLPDQTVLASKIRIWAFEDAQVYASVFRLKLGYIRPGLEIYRGVETNLVTFCERHNPTPLFVIPEDLGVSKRRFCTWAWVWHYGIAFIRDEAVPIVGGIEKRLLLHPICHLCNDGHNGTPAKASRVVYVDHGAAGLDVTEYNATGRVRFVLLQYHAPASPVYHVGACDVIPFRPP